MVSARSRGRVAVWLVLATAACAPAASGGLRGASEGTGEGGFSRRDERQYIGSYADVRAVAVSRRYAYVATPSGVGVYDRLRGAWEAPFTRENGLVDAQITVIAGDPAEDAVWIGVPGAVVMYRPLTMSVLRTMIAGIPDVIAMTRAALATPMSAPAGNGRAYRVPVSPPRSRTRRRRRPWWSQPRSVTL